MKQMQIKLEGKNRINKKETTKPQVPHIASPSISMPAFLRTAWKQAMLLPYRETAKKLSKREKQEAFKSAIRF